MKCAHQMTSEGPAYGFSASVALRPYTQENRAAHGGISCTEECVACGAQRSVNHNAGQQEHGPWGESREQREDRARLEAARIERQRLAAEDATFAARARLGAVDYDRVSISIDGRPYRYIDHAAIVAAAGQPDTGDGLVPFYRAMLRALKS